MRLDEMEGADIMMVKPAGAYLDVIRLLRDNTTLPISAYQVRHPPVLLQLAVGGGQQQRQQWKQRSRFDPYQGVAHLTWAWAGCGPAGVRRVFHDQGGGGARHAGRA
jgi:hypothetical protein